ncbi:hypothetical protein H4Q26_001082 [Puccinia striiformis f. sp. tritici PST-130]|nr:hypothetical protein H4Q26_001082 [Puccinia striiformis f. sp. tritici PST-130]
MMFQVIGTPPCSAARATNQPEATETFAIGGCRIPYESHRGEEGNLQLAQAGSSKESRHLPSLRKDLLVLTIFHSLLISLSFSVAASHVGHGIVPNSRTNSTAVRVFSFERAISWANQDFFVSEITGPASLHVQTRFDRPARAAFSMIVTVPQIHQFSIGLELEPDINTQLEWCGYKQTYRTSDSIDYEFNPRGWLTDSWKIKKGRLLAEDYVWERNRMGLAGPIKDKQGRQVAHFHARTWGQQWVAMSWHSKVPHATTYTIETNDEIPIEYLVGLFTVAIVRMDKCGR